MDAGPLLRFDAGPRPLRPCPTSGPGAMEGDGCFVLTPAEAGLPASGGGATVDQYALRPNGPARGQLLVFLNGSGGAPRNGAGSATGSWFGVARAQGLHVLAPSYVSGSALGTLCAGIDACFEPSRLSILTGVPQPDAAAELADLTPDEGVSERLASALLTLEATDVDGGWGQFVDPQKRLEPETAIRWEKVFVSGHSQGAGHAALLGKRHQVARALLLAGPCDGVGGGLASWLSSPAGFRTQPSTHFVGLGAAGDLLCPRAPEAWDALGLPAASQTRDAASCPLATPHTAPLTCESNAAEWARRLAP